MLEEFLAIPHSQPIVVYRGCSHKTASSVAPACPYSQKNLHYASIMLSTVKHVLFHYYAGILYASLVTSSVIVYKTDEH